MAAILLGDRKLTDLKVTELKAELDKRGLPKRGVKSVLLERLKKAILQEELSNVNDEEEHESEQEVSLDDSQLDSSQLSVGEEEAVPAVDVDAPVATDDKLASSNVEASDVVVEEPVVEVLEDDASIEVSTQLETKDSQEPEKQVSCEETVAEDVETVTMETNGMIDMNVESDREGEGEGERQTSSHQQPMDIGSPLDSEHEFDLSGRTSVPADRDGDTEHHDVTDEQEQPQDTNEEDKEDLEEVVEKGDEDEKKEDGDSRERRVDRLDSNFDSSYQPGSEELLYEGDPDNEIETKPENEQEGDSQVVEEDAAVGLGIEYGSAETTMEKREEEEGFMVEVHYKDQGGSLEDPSTGASNESEKKLDGKSSSGGGKMTAGDSTRPRNTMIEAIIGERVFLKSYTTNPDRTLSGCHLWVAGLVSSVRALDLQTLFSSFGQVLSAKVVAKAHSKARFGYVTLSTPEQAQKCIAELNGSELKGSTIHVELAKNPPPLSQPSSDETKSSTHRSGPLPGSSRSKDSEGKDNQDSHRDKDKVGQSITKSSTSGDSKGSGKGGDRKDERRRSSGSSRYHGDDRSSHSRRSRSPPKRSPRGGRARGGRSPPPRGGYGGPSPRGQVHSRDARHDIIRREEQRRDLMERRLGADPYYRDSSRQVMVDDRRFADRYQEMAARRQMEMEHTRREQEMARRMQEVREREAREREIRERQLAEQERLFKERERVMREREYRERQRREQLEKELREREQREKDLRERERRLREQHIRELQEREMKVAREREMREREVQAQVQRERELHEKEQRLLQEHQRIQKEKQLYEEQQRRLREEAERQAREREAREREAREREAREREVREREARERERKLEVERERRLREEKERERRERERVEEERVKLERAAKLEREREQKRKQDELKWEQRDREQRDREQRDRVMQQQQQRLGKRSSYQDSPSFDVSKRQAVHDIRGSSGVHGNDVRSGSGAAGMGSGNMDVYDMSSSVFSRLDPQKQAAAAVGQLASGIQSITGMMQGGKTGVTSPEGYGRRSVGDTGGGGGGGVGYRPGSGGFGSGALGRDRHLESVSYPMSGMGKGGPNSPNYPKTSGIGGGVTVVQKGGLSRQNQEIISAALANIQKSVHQSPTSAASQAMRMPGSSPIGQQISPGGHMTSLGDFVSLNRGQSVGGQMSSMGGVGRPLMGGVGPMGKPMNKLPPEDERYNRRFSRPSHGGRQPNIKRF